MSYLDKLREINGEGKKQEKEIEDKGIYPIYLKSHIANVFYKLINRKEILTVFDTVDQKTIEHYIAPKYNAVVEQYIRNKGNYKTISSTEFDIVANKVRNYLNQLFLFLEKQV